MIYRWHAAKFMGRCISCNENIYCGDTVMTSWKPRLRTYCRQCGNRRETAEKLRQVDESERLSGAELMARRTKTRED